VVCPNCGHRAQHYCPHCGQKQHGEHPSLLRFARELVQETLSVEGRLFTTLRSVLTRPGQLTLDFLEGRRARHISPLRLFLIVFAIYFLVSSEVFDLGERLMPVLQAAIEPRAAARGLAVDQMIAQSNDTIIAGVKAMRAGALVLSSLWYWLLFRRQRPHFIDHLVLSLQLACFALSIGILANLIARWAGNISVGPVVALPLSVTYAALSVHRVYAASWPTVLWKVGLVYAINVPIAAVIILGWTGFVLLYL
jgi:hypothetical protein